MQTINEVYNQNCLIGLKSYPDNFFDLAIVDPPYGVKIANTGTLSKTTKLNRGFKQVKAYRAPKWDNKIPTKRYFTELKRVSKNQIIWGGNFFSHILGPCKCYIVWYKKGKDRNPRFSPVEMAWTSFNKLPKFYDIPWLGFACINSGEKKIHPCQKPLQLYRNCLSDFTLPGYKILDTHMGSQSSRIVCYEMDFNFWGWEIDIKHFHEGNIRFNKAKEKYCFQ